MNASLKANPVAVSAANAANEKQLLRYINLKLALLGCPQVKLPHADEFATMATALLQHHQETDRLLADYLCPADQRIQNYIDGLIGKGAARLPSRSFVLDRLGLARLLSLPPDRDEFNSDIVRSYRVKQGVLHNPKSDRRTTQGSFHVAEGGLPIPDDKLSVPKNTFGHLQIGRAHV